jgi:glyceraldehyde 3-phosphate dehydrogenase
MKRVAINGFGRMGRLATRVIEERDDLQVVVINEPNGALETLAVLLEFDSVQGRWAHTCTPAGEAALAIASRRVPVLREKAPARIPWRDDGIEIVLECSGKFRTRELLEPHVANGAQRVVVSEVRCQARSSEVRCRLEERAWHGTPFSALDLMIRRSLTSDA